MTLQSVPCIGGPRNGERVRINLSLPNDTLHGVPTAKGDAVDMYRVVDMRASWNGQPKIHTVLVFAELPAYETPFDLLIAGYRRP